MTGKSLSGIRGHKQRARGAALPQAYAPAARAAGGAPARAAEGDFAPEDEDMDEDVELGNDDDSDISEVVDTGPSLSTKLCRRGVPCFACAKTLGQWTIGRAFVDCHANTKGQGSKCARCQDVRKTKGCEDVSLPSSFK